MGPVSSQTTQRNKNCELPVYMTIKLTVWQSSPSSEHKQPPWQTEALLPLLLTAIFLHKPALIDNGTEKSTYANKCKTNIQHSRNNGWQTTGALWQRWKKAVALIVPLFCQWVHKTSCKYFYSKAEEKQLTWYSLSLWAHEMLEGHINQSTS